MIKTTIYIFKSVFDFESVNIRSISKIVAVAICKCQCYISKLFGMSAVSSALPYTINIGLTQIDCAKELKNRS